MDRDELAAWLRLSLTPGVGNGAARRLLAAFGLPQAVFAQTEAAWQSCVTVAQARALAAVPEGLDALLEQTWQWLQADAEPARAIVTLGDAAYPPALLATEDPPLLLYLLGAPQFVRGRPFAPPRCLAMVGSRNPTAQGADHARQFARALRAAGLTIVSGLALGVDAAAHEGALQGPPDPATPATIAVVGTGLDRVYPRANKELAHRIARHGLLVSEYPLGTPPLAANFPKRNRIISGLSQGTLVVEAALASGSLITARLAAEQGREVFAIPGSIHAPQSRGCHALLRQGAKLVETAQDVLEELRLPAAEQAPASDAPPPAAPAHQEVLDALGFDPLGLDALVARTGLPAATLQVRLLELELDGQVARLPGGLFQRVGSA
ncbi:DNA processing protein DprA [Alicycliphilus denitrificans]|uniref:DNA-processing protein DprA n=1 Tax=Alicycliphilus denitrificans TaxID=179636 RepID=UPI00095EF7D7|nr:DNA-processing protein DprA [Alicycliphilus denitrificans]MBN9573482.1 DNA-processing protein DprA [Alicycliphilus denitrificans]OJW92015.1 MAG: DNA protecting protein DprA [Alicycliphilus sp. 69-12]BCN41157.1 DNA processing protein DprA [Alicycliphilus denitrificans]